ncbi:MAG: HAD family phosphatase [Lewinellaceae bacterium]|nr:HAD family phosphatase [Lewinella sp.]MCB9278369.1 HAD family phosphatase [Lewinellaceae bacterium]
MIDSIVFDLGAVLIDWSPEYLYRDLIPDDRERAYFLSEICNHEWNIQQDAGRPWSEAVDELTGKYPGYSREIEAYWQEWPRMLGGPISGTVEILEDLAQNYDYRLLALTNWSAETWHFAEERFAFLNRFEGILVSGEEKLKKPDPAIYQRLFSRFNLSAGSALFIDDNPDNVRAAETLGMKGIRFRDPDQLRADLKASGLLK